MREEKKSSTALFRPVQFPRDVNVIHEALNVKRQVWRVGTHQLFQLFTLLVEANQGSRLGLDIQLVLLGKFLTKVFHQHLVKILPTQLRVTRCGEDLRSGRRKKPVVVTKRTHAANETIEKFRIHDSVLRTLSFPLLKAHTDVWNPEWPRSTNTTFLAFSSGVGRSCL